MKSGRFLYKYRGEKKCLFIDVPKCTAKKGIFKSVYGKDAAPSMQVMLIFKKDNPEQMQFVDFMKDLLMQAVDSLELGSYCNPIKASTYTQDEFVMYCKLDTESEGSGNLRLTSKMEGFPSIEMSRSSFQMSGTMKISGMCGTPKGTTFMRRISRIVYKGPPGN